MLRYLRYSLLAVLMIVALVTACHDTADDPVAIRSDAPTGHALGGAWSDPVHLGSVSSGINEVAPSLSPNLLSLYFGRGGDIFVAHRSCAVCTFGEAEPLPAPVNTPAGEAGPSLSADGRFLFFNSTREGSADIYVSARGASDGGGWATPTKLGMGVNTPGDENNPHFLALPDEAYAAPGSAGVLYFGRGRGDIFAVGLTRDFEPTGAAVPVVELNHASFSDGGPSLTADGRRIFFHSARPGSQPPDAPAPFYDVWTASRPNIHEPWSDPVNLGPIVNSEALDWQPGISLDGRTLVFTSARAPTVGGWDLWMAKRTGF